jgi:hypothetical protein
MKAEACPNSIVGQQDKGRRSKPIKVSACPSLSALSSLFVTSRRAPPPFRDLRKKVQVHKVFKALTTDDGGNHDLALLSRDGLLAELDLKVAPNFLSVKVFQTLQVRDDVLHLAFDLPPAGLAVVVTRHDNSFFVEFTRELGAVTIKQIGPARTK